jgi:hypothetical protein
MQPMADDPVIPVRLLHPRRGPHRPAGPAPARRAGSVRRTVTLDAQRPDGLDGAVQLVGRARDLRTGFDGDATVIGVAGLSGAVDYHDERRVRRVETDPPADLAALEGTPALVGFRAAVARALPGEQTLGTLRHQLLDDVPMVVLVCGVAMSAAGRRLERSPAQQAAQVPDLCAGWVETGTMRDEERRSGLIPVVTGPLAPAVAEATDPLAWHELPARPVHTVRRHRRIDVWSDGAHVAVDAFFRDSHLDVHHRETVIHEYLVTATFDPITGAFTACHADPRALPWQECPGAAASAGRLAGVGAADVRAAVRTSFTGPSTCTHLNDTLRALADVAVLARALSETGPSR